MATEKKQKAPSAKKADARELGLTSVKGMHDLVGREYYQVQGFIEKAAEISHYYGFKPIDTPMLEHEALFHSGVGEGTDIVEKEM